MSNYKKINISYIPDNHAGLCKGGYYMWQSDSERSKYCRNLASTKKGRQEIAKSECRTAYTGGPNIKFNFTNMYENKWNNTSCDGVL